MSNQLQTQDSRVENRFTRQDLVRSQTLLQRQCLPLEDKVRMSLARIRAWYCINDLGMGKVLDDLGVKHSEDGQKSLWSDDQP